MEEEVEEEEQEEKQDGEEEKEEEEIRCRWGCCQLVGHKGELPAHANEQPH